MARRSAGHPGDVCTNIESKSAGAFFGTASLQDFNWVARTPAGHDMGWGGESSAPNTTKPPLFSDGYRPGAIRELGVLYGGTVMVSS
jgi:hypothetical protein